VYISFSSMGCLNLILFIVFRLKHCWQLYKHFTLLICLSPYVTSKLAHLFTKSCSKRYANYEPSLVFNSKFSPTHGLQRLIQTQYCGVQILTRQLCTSSNVLPFIFPLLFSSKTWHPIHPKSSLLWWDIGTPTSALGGRHCLVSSNEWKRKSIRCCCIRSPLQWQSPFEVWHLTQPILVAQGKTQSLISFSQNSKAIRFQDFEYLV
jgi:hypothetical protein